MKKLMMGFLTFAIVTTLANQLLAQAPQFRCTLTEATAPTVRGLKLGMTTQQVVDLFPAVIKRREMKDDIEKAKAGGSEVVYLAFEPAGDGGGDRFAGVASVVTGLQKNKVVDFSVTYVGPTWSSIDEWVARLAEAFKLPNALWVAGPSENPNKVLRCSGIEIEAGIQGGGSSVRIRTTDSIKGPSSSGEDNKRFKP
ncbi:MAG: hypothetical protein AABO41_25295 [Acidobacteriota bacterium]